MTLFKFSSLILFLNITFFLGQDFNKPEIEVYKNKYPSADAVFTKYEKKIEQVEDLYQLTYSRLSQSQLIEKTKDLKEGFLYKLTCISREYFVIYPENEELGSLVIELGAEDILLNFKIEIISAKGIKKEIRKKDFIEQIHSDGSKALSLLYPGIEVGTVVIEYYEILHVASTDVPSLEYFEKLQSSDPILNYSYQFKFPISWRINIKNIIKKYGIKHSLHPVKGNAQVLSVKLNTILESKNEPYSPYLYQRIPFLQFSIVQMAFSRFLYTHPTNWSKFLRNHPYLTFEGVSLNSRKLLMYTKNAIDWKKNKKEDLLYSILHYMNSFKVDPYAGTTTLTELIDLGYGTKKSIVGLFIALLREGNFSFKIGLLHDKREGKIDYNYKSHREANIPYFQIKLDNEVKSIILSPKYLAPDTFPIYALDSEGFILNGNDADLFVTPVKNKVVDEIEIQLRILIDTSGEATIYENRIYRGLAAQRKRNVILNLSKNEQSHYLKNSVLLITEKLSEVQIKSHQLKNIQNDLVLEMQYSTKNIVYLGSEKILLLNKFLHNREKQIELENSSKRENEFIIKDDSLLTKSISVIFPKSWEIKEYPKDVSFENNVWKLEKTITQSEGELKIIKKCKLKKVHGDKNLVDAYLSPNLNLFNTDTIIFN